MQPQRSPVASASSEEGQNSGEGSSSQDYYDEDDSDDDDYSEYSEGEFIMPSPSQPQRITLQQESTPNDMASDVHGESDNLQSIPDRHQHVEVCFICRETDMSFSINDPQGRPLCMSPLTIAMFIVHSWLTSI